MKRNDCSSRRRWRVVRLGLAALIAHAANAATLEAQTRHGADTAADTAAVTSQVYRATGMHVEVLGLARWTPVMLRDSVYAYGRGIPLASAKVTDVLRHRLGFPEALAGKIPGDSGYTGVIAVVEPQDSARVHRRRLAGDTVASTAPWPELVEYVRTHPNDLVAGFEALIAAHAANIAPTIPTELRPDSATVRGVWNLLAAHHTAKDLADGVGLVASAPNPYDRLAAVALLATFERDERAWQALVGALLDSDERVRAFANTVLVKFTKEAPRRVDWRPAAGDLHAVLDGSTLFALLDVMNMLVVTHVDPALAAPLLQDGGQGVLMFAGATPAPIRRVSYRFLRTISGKDLGGAPGPWQAWMTGLGL